ncbi:MAG TPA: GNAT family N-acetyltransferase [Gemmatimonadales bacterium]|nr:GNAT family N-acetyltransferase [Gemmatimonadales bacterium]
MPPALTAADWMRMHVRALFTLDSAGRLLRINEPGGGPAPRFYIGWTREENRWWSRSDLDPAVAAELGRLCQSRSAGPEEEPAVDLLESLIACLARYAPVMRTWAGPAFYFPSRVPDSDNAVRVTADNADVLSPWLEAWRSDARGGVPMAAVLVDGRAVSVCGSVRMTPEAHEAGVETHPGFRRQGHAAQAVTAWIRIVRELDCHPLYSTSWDNRASRAVAQKLGLVQFGSDLHLT